MLQSKVGIQLHCVPPKVSPYPGFSTVANENLTESNIYSDSRNFNKVTIKSKELLYKCRCHQQFFYTFSKQYPKVHGKDRIGFMESLTVADVKGLETNQGTLSVFTLPNGGIVDDLIVTKAEDHLYVVSNAGRREQDIPLMLAKEAEMKTDGKDVALELLEDRGLLALQGPSMTKCLQPLTDLQLDKLGFMHSAVAHVAGIECRVTRYCIKIS